MDNLIITSRRKGPSRGRGAARGAAGGAALAAVVLTAPLARAEQEASSRPLQIVPFVGLELGFTDNVRVGALERRSDTLVRAVFGADAELKAVRATGRLAGRLTYDRYLGESHLSGVGLDGRAEAAYVIVPEHLRLEAAGAVTNDYAAAFAAPAADRAGVPGRTQVAVYQVGPRLTTDVAGALDLAAAARFAQVFYSAADGSPAAVPLPARDSLTQLVGKLDTGARRRGYQLLTTSEVLNDNHGYHAANAVQSVFISLTPRLRLLARGGYESVHQTGVAPIDAAVLSAGLEFTPNARSRVSLEGGRRYDRAAWAGSATIGLTNRLTLNARYAEAIQPDQVVLAASFEALVDRTASLPLPVAPTAAAPFLLTGNLYNQTSFRKAADLDLVYGGPTQSLSLSVRWSDREFLASRNHDRTLLAAAAFERALKPDLTAAVEANYARTYASPVYGPGRSYGLGARLDYRVNSTTDLTARYAFRSGRQLGRVDQGVHDSTLMIGLLKRF